MRVKGVNTWVHVSVSYLDVGWFSGDGWGLRASVTVPDDSRYDATTGAGYRALQAAAQRLPGVGSGVNAPLVVIDDSIPGRWQVAITVFWQQPGERAAHRAVAAGMLPRP